MNSTAMGTAARAVGLALILALAAAFGLVVGNAINGRTADGGPNISGYVPGNPGGTVVNSRTATAAFSLDAMAALQATRGDAAAAQDYVDYGVRHAEPKAETVVEAIEKLTAPRPR